MQDNVCVITTVRDDDVMLRKWVDYYGGLFGRDALYILNHGNQQAVHEIAAGCNLIAIPDFRSNGFTARRWRSQNHLMNSLRNWYTHVIVCDVDEFVIIDPNTGHTLASYMETLERGGVQTALGVEIVHLTDRETDGIDTAILGPRRYAQLNSWYTKPCLIGTETKLSRGGHFCSHKTIDAPDFLYLFHMKFCDYPLYVDTLNRRQGLIKDMGVKELTDTTTNVQWFALERDDAELFGAFQKRHIRQRWNFARARKKMVETYRPRKNELYHFDNPSSNKIFEVPERFFGIV